jgi:hypothetical protein
MPASLEGSANRSGFTGIASEGNGDMLFSAPAIVRGVKGDPMLAGYQNFDPCVGCHRTNQFLRFAVFPFDWRGFDVATDIAGGQTSCSQYTQHDVGKILAYANSVTPDRSDIRRKICRSFSVLKVFVDRTVESFQALPQGRWTVQIPS